MKKYTLYLVLFPDSIIIGLDEGVTRLLSKQYYFSNVDEEMKKAIKRHAKEEFNSLLDALDLDKVNVVFDIV